MLCKVDCIRIGSVSHLGFSGSKCHWRNAGYRWILLWLSGPLINASPVIFSVYFCHEYFWNYVFLFVIYFALYKKNIFIWLAKAQNSVWISSVGERSPTVGATTCCLPEYIFSRKLESEKFRFILGHPDMGKGVSTGTFTAQNSIWLLKPMWKCGSVFSFECLHHCFVLLFDF